MFDIFAHMEQAEKSSQLDKPVTPKKEIKEEPKQEKIIIEEAVEQEEETAQEQEEITENDSETDL